jgi:hypothetical protein
MKRLINVHRPSTSPKIGDTRPGTYVPVTYVAGGARVSATLADLAAYVANPEGFVTGVLAHRAQGRRRQG